MPPIIWQERVSLSPPKPRNNNNNSSNNSNNNNKFITVPIRYQVTATVVLKQQSQSTIEFSTEHTYRKTNISFNITIQTALKNPHSQNNKKSNQQSPSMKITQKHPSLIAASLLTPITLQNILKQNQHKSTWSTKLKDFRGKNQTHSSSQIA